MNIVIATGIYPPEIGGTATYAREFAEAMRKRGHRVRVVTYGKIENACLPDRQGKLKIENDMVVTVSKSGGCISRWMRYAKVLREVAKDVDAVITLSSVSTGIPLILARLQKSKKILRLGGDFFWERYTDAGGQKSLREWYASRLGFWRLMNTCFMEGILRSFDALAYSTEFQKKIHETEFSPLPRCGVIENAKPTSIPVAHTPRSPFRLLFMGRYVGFKNLFTLLDAVASLDGVILTMVGSGPLEGRLRARAGLLGLSSRVQFLPPVSGDEKKKVFAEHDLLILPSVTEISPNVALEASAHGLPVLLTSETGLKASSSIRIRPLRTSSEIASEVPCAIDHYDFGVDTSNRTYDRVAEEWEVFLKHL